MACSRFSVSSVVLTLALAGSLWSAGMGCGGKDPYRPGESLGAFHVVGKLVATSCGATPARWEFDVRLRHDRTTLYWVQGDAPISARVDASASVTLTASATQTMRTADARSKRSACTMARNDVVAIALAPLDMPVTDLAGTTTFAGTLAYHFAPTEPSACEGQLADVGGDFAALPCDVKYEVAGIRTGDAR